MDRSKDCIVGFLADTWWFGLSCRLSELGFRQLATLRRSQGFSAIQLVVGIPPEVGPENINAQSPVGFPWTLAGDVNAKYLALAQDRIQFLNGLGFVVIVYGAWGHQIEWLGEVGMTAWWLNIIRYLDSLNVIFCLCGESNLWVGEASKLLPDRSTYNLVENRVFPKLPLHMKPALAKVRRHLKQRLYKPQLEQRRKVWSSVLETISQKTNRPIIVHPTPDETGYEAVCNPELLSANTVQTGHTASARNRLWQLPLAHRNRYPHVGFINLEPWYEGICDQFGTEDQLFAYWATMLAGAISYCYGAHGIWNVGDGKFLAHWGKQTFDQALALDTPRLLGLSHQQYLAWGDFQGTVFYQTAGAELITLSRKQGSKMIQFLPDVARFKGVPRGKIWLPLQGAFASQVPARGPVVVFCE